MGNTTRKSPALRRLATFLAALGMLTMSSGLVLMSTASANTNLPETWQTLPGEICEKSDLEAESGAYVVPAAPEGFEWSKLIIKKGAGNIGVENQVFNNPVAGMGYTWVGFNPQQSGGWSHTILCRVPIPEPDLATAAIAVIQPACENDNAPSIEFSGTNVVLPFVVDGTVAPGETVTVTATAVDGAEFEGGSATKVFDGVAFDTAEEGCDEVLPPEEEEEEPEPTVTVLPPTVTPTVTPTVVSAGLPAADLRGEQGLALLVAGMVLMVVAGGLGVVRPTGAVRS